ncbi:MAG: MFS transporter [Burkholderiaceae bacterium]
MDKPLFRQRDFLCLWWVGFVSFLIRWLEVLVFGVFTYNQTGSAFLVAMMTMVRLLPMALFGAVLGVLAERFVRRDALVVVLGVSLATAVVLTIIGVAGHLQVWHLAVGAFVNGTAWATDNPVRRAMIGEVAGPERISQAMSFEVGTSNATRLAGPSVGGFLLFWAGIQGTFMLSVVLYGSALVLALAVRQRNQPADKQGRPSVIHSLASGFKVMSRDPRLVGGMWLTIVFNLFAWPVLSMVPVIGKDQLGLAASGVGLLSSTDGLGALAGAIIVSRLATPARYGVIYASGILLFLAMVPVFALSTSPVIAAMALFMVGAGQAAFAVMQSTITLVTAPPGMRSQAMGLMTMCIGMGPFGFVLIGLLADALGAPTTALTMSALGLTVMAASWPWWRATWAMRAPGAPDQARASTRAN